MTTDKSEVRSLKSEGLPPLIGGGQGRSDEEVEASVSAALVMLIVLALVMVLAGIVTATVASPKATVTVEAADGR